MKEFISRIADRLFAAVPYSKASDEIKEKVTDSLGEQYSRISDGGQDEMKALGEVMSRYGALEDAAELAGVGRETLSTISDSTLSMGKRSFERMFFGVRLCLIIMAWFFASTVNTVCHAFYFRSAFYVVSFLIYFVPVFLLMLLCRRSFLRMSYDRVSLLPEAKRKFDLYFDRYQKRLPNSLLLFVGCYTFYTVTFIESLLHSNLNGDEVVALIESNMYILMLGLIICFKNALYLMFLGHSVSDTKRRKTRRYMLICTAVCAVYLVLSTALICLAEYLFSGAYKFFYLMSAIFIGVFYAIGFRKREKLVTRNFTLNRPRIAVFAAAAITVGFVTTLQRDVYVLTPYIMSVSEVAHTDHDISYDDECGVYTITAGEGDFKILHLTDIHIGGSVNSSFKDYKALEACRKLIEHTEPDFVIVTGDLVFPMGIMSMSLNNQAPVTQFANFMRNIGIPWAYTFGNHDTESMATGSRSDICELYESLSYKTSGSLLYPYTQPDITGRSNQLIMLENPDGSARQALFLIDSNDYTGEGLNDYDYIHDDQVDWYSEQIGTLSEKYGKTVPSMLFFHIPLQQYRTAYELYESGSDEVRYHFGVIGETMIDKICCSDHPSKLFDTALELGSTKAIFCGHDHYNNISLEYKGIRLTYGMSIDYLAMPGIDQRTEQRGAELITVHSDSTFDVGQIKLTDIE